MARQSLIWPVGVIAAALLIMLLLPIWGSELSRAAPSLACENGDSDYPDPCQTQTAVSSAVTATTIPTATVRSTAATATNTITPAAATTTAATPTVSRVPTLTPIPAVTRGSPVPPPTAQMIDGAVPCIPGTQILVEGVGPRNTALLLYFGGQPVGGATSGADGSYSIPLRIGHERPAFYPVQVQVRGTRAVIREFTCLVPYFTPTPTQRPRSPYR
jgi:hypothetical protein